ncbi:MAG: phosphoribosylformylglycinamidine synthase subunit PurS, partial [Planctomycetes bacterium]|nr:phosphoribosylformylglycinamidine synthase subunit PurS [Planctomycetota bacterium]
MTHRIEIWLRDECGDGRAAGVFAQAKELGASGITAVRSARLFFLRGSLDEAQLNRLADELLADPVIERYVLGASAAPNDGAVVEV